MPASLHHSLGPTPSATGDDFKWEKGLVGGFQEACSLHIWNSYVNSRSLSVSAALIGCSPALSPGPTVGHVTTCWLIKSRHLDFQRTSVGRLGL